MTIKLSGKVELRGDGEPVLASVTFMNLPLSARRGRVRMQDGNGKIETTIGY